MFKHTAILLLSALVLSATNIAAQATKYGHMNLGNLLELLPEVKKANTDLTAYANTFAAKDDSMANIIQKAGEQLQKDYESGTFPAAVIQERYQSLQKEQANLEAFEKSAQDQVAVRRDELLNPILTKVLDAVKAVGKENGYAMIFDISSGATLFASDSDDVTALVKKKLGIQ